MKGSENPETPKADVESVLAEFGRKEDVLTAFCARTKSLIEASLQDVSIRYESVQARVKTRKKLKEKYLDPAKNYKQLDDITDLAGLRVITYYEDDVDRVAEVIKREFDIDWKNSADKRGGEPDKFGYNAINYVCGHLEKRTSDVEYKKFAGVRCEIQITSILRHAWSEIEHEWYDLKDTYPKDVKRRFYRIAALLELAESEFLDIRKIRTQYERSVAVQVEANVPDLPVDAISLRAFIEKEPVVGEIDQALASLLGCGITDITDYLAELWSKGVNFTGITKLQDLRDSLKRYRVGIPEFVKRCGQEVWPAVQASEVNKGVCIAQLIMLLVSSRGKNETEELLKTVWGTASVGWELAAQVAIAQEIVARYRNKPL